MLSFLKRRRMLPITPAIPQVPAGSRIYAIGDVHGCATLLDRLLATIAADGAARRPAHTTLVMLGDLIDRGPDSRQVVERMLAVPQGVDELIVLRGNHEQFLLDALDRPEQAWGGWLTHGGRQTLMSYGIPERFAMTEPARLGDALRREIPRKHLELIEGALLSWRAGDYFFTHAGVRPGVPLDRQADRDLLLIRRDFLECEDDFGAVVVHGHSIGEAIEDRPNRIGLDTGAYRTGVLSAVCLEGAERRFLSASDAEHAGVGPYQAALA